MILVKKELQWSASVVLVALGLLTGVGACGGTEDSVCALAAAHVKACTGLEWAPETCGAEQAELAETALSFDCEAFQERKTSSGWLPGIRLHDKDQMSDAAFSFWLGMMDADPYDWVGGGWVGSGGTRHWYDWGY
jgi:hypothetical protein